MNVELFDLSITVIKELNLMREENTPYADFSFNDEEFYLIQNALNSYKRKSNTLINLKEHFVISNYQ
jgi:hypothetical protein